MNDITIVLNAYSRPELLQKQYESLLNQSIKPKEFLFWQNFESNFNKKLSHSDKLLINDTFKSSISNCNFGVWSRFYYALNARTEWICIFDDDTIPGKLWLENCLNTFHTHPGLLGTNGVLFGDDNYTLAVNIGWHKCDNNEPVEVDIVGHSWFFHRDMLTYFCRELPPLDHNFLVGEDIHFSYMLQKYSNYKTYVPPHPPGNSEMYGSINGFINSMHFGKPISDQHNNLKDMGKYIKHCCDNGFELIYKRNNK